ncbi:PEP-CTERM sorting domain-containing protein [Roseibacillus ishigakijimensis]|uniref:PEP-CTERM sorting domain-containing protein n=1 Tax=Roseibacillus ishigakijimensis TaxID=454146 RepID=A0A934VHZ8_9BACT|nr:PEP-CTERM sorting domain-containing protein [Roseibacillus ishigakijimensis]MBK1834528.1 PEP-CTERM sorting domain-containing protein [Roseibacillus ishigakijimensis]
MKNINLLSFLGLFSTLASSQAAIIGYYEVGGTYQESWGSSGNLVGGYYDGQNLSDIPTSQFFGADDHHFALIGGDGLSYQYRVYPLNGGDNSLSTTGTSTTLTGGPLAGQPIKNSSWLGSTNGVQYYADADGGVVRYYDYGTHSLHFDASWTSFSNGSLDGMATAVGLGLSDMGGGNAMNENLYVNIEADGTHEYYNLDNGFRSGESINGYGNWTTFSGGLLDGLTLTQLDANPVGTHNGVSYRFIGTSQDGMYFDIVPEPSTALLGLVGLAGLARRRRA